MRVIIIILSVILGISFFSAGARAQNVRSAMPGELTLKGLFAQALKNSETIAISEETVREAQALYRETLGGSFPEISYRRQTALEDNSDSATNGMFRITKTDLTGYRELAALRSGKATINQRKYELQRVKQLLLQDIAAAFYALLLAEENVASTEKLIKLAQDRLDELTERVRVGRARPVDAIAQEALKASLESQLEESVRQVNATRDLLAFLAGVPELDQTVSEGEISADRGLLETYLAAAKTRPDVQAAQENAKAFKGLRQAAQAEYWPSINLTGNSYTNRPLSQQDTDWDFLFAVEVPLWDWGARRGTVGAADAVFNQAELELQFSLRQAGLDVRNAYRDYESAKRQLEIQARLVDLARQDYEIQVTDDRQGLVSNLDVFESLDRLNNAELAFNNARLQEKLAIINLEIAAGAGPDEILK